MAKSEYEQRRSEAVLRLAHYGIKATEEHLSILQHCKDQAHVHRAIETLFGREVRAALKKKAEQEAIAAKVEREKPARDAYLAKKLDPTKDSPIAYPWDRKRAASKPK